MSFPNDAIASLNDNAPTGFTPFSQADSLISQLQNFAPKPVDEEHLPILSDLHYELGLEDFGRDSVSPHLATQDIADPTNYNDQGFLEDISDSSRVEAETLDPCPVASGLDSGKAKTASDPSPRKQKINISYIDDNRKRQVSFCKRKNGAMKKGRELNLMTGSMIGIFVFNPANGWYHEFGTHDPVEILNEYAKFTGPSERRRDAKFFDELEKAAAQPQQHPPTPPPPPPPPYPQVPGSPLQVAPSFNRQIKEQKSTAPSVDVPTVPVQIPPSLTHHLPDTLDENHIVPEVDETCFAPPCNIPSRVSYEIEEGNSVTFPPQRNDPSPATPPLSVNLINDEFHTDYSMILVGDQTDLHRTLSLPTQNEESELDNDDALRNVHVPTKRAVTVGYTEHLGSAIEISNTNEERERDEVVFPEIINDSPRQSLEEEPFLLSDDVQIQTLDPINNFTAAQEWDTFPTEPTPADGIPCPSDSLLMHSMFPIDGNENEKGDQVADKHLTSPFPTDESMLLWENELSMSGIGQKRSAPLSTDIVTNTKVRRLE